MKKRILPREKTLPQTEKRLQVLITDPVSQCCIDILQENGLDVTYNPKLQLQEILKEIPDYEILIVRSVTKLTKEVFNVANKLILVGLAGTWVDNVDLDYATGKGVSVINVPDGNTISAVEHTCAMLMAMARNIPQACSSMKALEWQRSSFKGTEVNGRTLAVVGLGHVGREVASRMKVFGMKTIGHDPKVTVDSAKEFGVELFPLEELWPLADFITLHVPLDAQTQNLIDDGVFDKCRDGVRVVDVVSGGIVCKHALLRALRSNKCGGAALDVFDEEPTRNIALIQHPKVICTPNFGANNNEAQLEASKQIAVQIVEFVNRKDLDELVDDSVNLAMTPENQPWVELAQRLSQILAALVSEEGNTEFTVNVTVYGDAAVENLTESIRVASLTRIKSYISQRSLIDSTNPVHESNVKVNVDVVATVPSQYTFNTGMLMWVNEKECTGSLVGSNRQGIAVLYSINTSVFESPVPLSQRLLIYSKDKTPDFVQVINELMKSKVTVNAVYCSKPSNQWFVVSTSTEKKENSLGEGKGPSVDELLTLG